MRYERRQGVVDGVSSILDPPPDGTAGPIPSDTNVPGGDGSSPSIPLDPSLPTPSSSVVPAPGTDTNVTPSVTSSSQISQSSSSSASTSTSIDSQLTDPPTPVRTESPLVDSSSASYTTFVTQMNGKLTTITSALPTDLASDSSSTESSRRTALIAGVTTGVAVLILVLLVAVFLCRRRLLRRRLGDSTRKKEVRALLEGEEFDDEDTFIRNLAMRSTGGPPASMSAHTTQAIDFGQANPMHINLNADFDTNNHPKESTFSTIGSSSSFGAYSTHPNNPYPFASFRRPESPTPSILKSRVSDTGSIFREEVWPPPESSSFVDPIEATSSQVDLSRIVDEVMGPVPSGHRYTRKQVEGEVGATPRRVGNASVAHERARTDDTMDSAMTTSSTWSNVGESAIEATRPKPRSRHSDPFKNPRSGSPPTSPYRSASPTSLSSSSDVSPSTFSPFSVIAEHESMSNAASDDAHRNSLDPLPPGASKPIIPGQPPFTRSPPSFAQQEPVLQPQLPMPPSSHAYHTPSSYSQLPDTPFRAGAPSQPKVSSPLARMRSGDARVWLTKRQKDSVDQPPFMDVSSQTASSSTRERLPDGDDENSERDRGWRSWMKGR